MLVTARPDTNVTYEPAGTFPAASSVTVVHASDGLALAFSMTAREGKAVKGSAGLLDGHEVMNAVARV